VSLLQNCLYGLSACDAGRVLGSLRSFLQESYV
jgi:hypothetical protein